jgi:hypothetical protein
VKLKPKTLPAASAIKLEPPGAIPALRNRSTDPGIVD